MRSIYFFKEYFRNISKKGKFIWQLKVKYKIY